MSKQNYKNYSKQVNKEPDKSENESDVLVEYDSAEETQTVKENDQDIPNENSSGTVSSGVVFNCEKLHIRERPSKDSKSVSIIDAGKIVEVDISSSTEDFYNVYTESGIEGFCMRDYIKLRG